MHRLLHKTEYTEYTEGPQKATSAHCLYLVSEWQDNLSLLYIVERTILEILTPGFCNYGSMCWETKILIISKRGKIGSHKIFPVTVKELVLIAGPIVAFKTPAY